MASVDRMSLRGRALSASRQTFQSLEIRDFRVLWFGFMGS